VTEAAEQDSLRASFAEVSAAQKAAMEELAKLHGEHPLNKAFTDAVEEVWRALPRHAKRRYRWDKAAKELGERRIAEIREPFVEAANKLYTAIEVKREATTKRLMRLAERLKARPGDVWMRFSHHWGGSYSSQTQPKHYARVRALLDVEAVKAVAPDVPVELREDDAGPEAQHKYSAEVFVRVVDEVDLTVLRYGPGLTVREMVRLAWRLGSNPRVFWSWLSPTYEASEGLDYFGNDLRAAPAQRVV
jgi:hypothetical protein